LAAVVDAWTKLPDGIKAGILAMLRSGGCLIQIFTSCGLLVAAVDRPTRQYALFVARANEAAQA